MTEKKHNALEVLGKVSGLGTEDTKRIFEECRANQARLEACTRHDFEPVDVDNRFGMYRCRRCGGKLDVLNVSWYNRGLADAQR